MERLSIRSSPDPRSGSSPHSTIARAWKFWRQRVIGPRDVGRFGLVSLPPTGQALFGIGYAPGQPHGRRR